MVTAKCSICGEDIRSRKSDKSSARDNLLRAIGKHMWKKHPEAMKRRISQGKARNTDNPIIQDFLEALEKGVAETIGFLRGTTKKSRAKTIKQIIPFRKFLGPTEKLILDLIEAIWDDEGKLIVYYK